MGFRLSRLTAVLAVLGLIATACGGGASGADTAEAPAAIPFEQEAEEETITTAPPLDRLIVAARNDINASPLWIADSEGFFEANGIEIQFLPVTDASALTSALLQNRAQVVVDSSSTAIRRFANNGAEISLISYLEATTPATSPERGSMSLVAALEDGEEATEWDGCDLVGKVIGVDSFVSLQAIALRQMLAASECSDTPVFEDGIRAGTSTLIVDAEADTDAQEADTDAQEEADTDAQEAATDDVDEFDGGFDADDIVQLLELDATSLKLGLKSDGSDPSLQRLDAGVFAEPNTTRLLRENEDDDVEVNVGLVTNLDLQLCNRFATRCASTVVVADNTWLSNNADVARRFNDSIDQAIVWIGQSNIDYRAALVSCCAITPNDASDIPRPNFVGRAGDLRTDLSPIVDVLERLGKIEPDSVSLDRLVPQEMG